MCSYDIMLCESGIISLICRFLTLIACLSSLPLSGVLTCECRCRCADVGECGCRCRCADVGECGCRCRCADADECRCECT